MCAGRIMYSMGKSMFIGSIMYIVTMYVGRIMYIVTMHVGRIMYLGNTMYVG